MVLKMSNEKKNQQKKNKISQTHRNNSNTLGYTRRTNKQLMETRIFKQPGVRNIEKLKRGGFIVSKFNELMVYFR